MADYQAQVAALLAPPRPVLAQAYLDEVCRQQAVIVGGSGGGSSGSGSGNDGPPVEVRLNAGPNRGKGIFALRTFQRGDLLFRERPLVAMQHASSAATASVCAHCFTFVGSVAALVARKLTDALTKAEGVHARQAQAQEQRGVAGVAGGGSGGGGDNAEAPAQQHAGDKRAAGGGAEHGGNDSDCGDHDHHGGGGGSDGAGAAAAELDPEEVEAIEARAAAVAAAGLDAAQLRALAEAGARVHSGGGGGEGGGENSGDTSTGGGLPHSGRVPLPRALPCRAGCSAQYCSGACEAAAWRMQHVLLCPGCPLAAGSPAPAPAPAPGAAGSAAGAVGEPAGSAVDGGGSSAAAGAASAVAGASGDAGGVLVSDRDRLAAFYAHAASTNEIFVLAAKVVVLTLVRAEEILRGGTCSDAHGGAGDPAGGVDSSGCGGGGGAAAADGAGSKVPGALAAADAALARCGTTAWARDPGPDPAPGAAPAQQQQQQQQAADQQAAVYGAIVGMFELNNLSVSVPSPLEDYFPMIHELPEDERAAAKKVTQRFLDALGESYDEAAEGTGFYALQSCVNHSCVPLACAEGETTGEASILALGHIAPGTEVTLSYINEEAGFKERTAALRDYGFRCACDKCARDRARRAAALAKRSGRK
ncbi:hypothetical protein FOA52_010970 [Chlamydomonas sp. UWO 241]|nr:hypothetical protein FOA52_010970 [Chlamydomonas sp. UWO 241]